MSLKSFAQGAGEMWAAEDIYREWGAFSRRLEHNILAGIVNTESKSFYNLISLSAEGRM